MVIITNFLTLTCENDQHESILSIMFYKKSFIWVIETLNDLLQKVKNIDNSIKRNKLSNHYFALKKYIEDSYDENSIFSSLFFVNSKVYEYVLTKDESKVIEEYKIRDYLLYCDSIFKTQYFQDLFYNFDFNYSFIVNKNECVIKKWNQNKDKIVESGKYDKELYEKIRKVYNYKNMIYIYGNHSKGNKDILTLSSPKIILDKDDYSRNEICEISEKEELKANHIILQQRLQDLQNQQKIDLFVFGKLKFEIKDAIESYSIKELFIQKDKYQKLHSWIDKDAFNFKVYFIDRIESGDIGDTFIQNYNGVMGIKYY
jgi:hypothetical protein